MPDATLAQSDHRGDGESYFFNGERPIGGRGVISTAEIFGPEPLPPPEMKMLKLLIFLINLVTTLDFDVAHDISEKVDQLENLWVQDLSSFQIQAFPSFTDLAPASRFARFSVGLEMSASAARMNSSDEGNGPFASTSCRNSTARASSLWSSCPCRSRSSAE